MLLKYWNTIKFLKVSQIFFRLFYYFYNPRIHKKDIPNKSENFGLWNQAIKKNSSSNFIDNFRFINQSRTIKLPNDWQAHSFGKLWLYNLHYFDYLYSKDITNEESTDLKIDLLIKWIEGNPIKEGVGWEQYPTSLRIVNWIKWLNENSIDNDFIDESLAIQTRYLIKKIEFHLSANHLLANAKALIFSGLYFNNPESEKWLKRGIGLLSLELKHQILNDGAHYERSPMYHSIIMEDILDIVQISRLQPNRIKDNLLDDLEETFRKMFKWLMWMTHPDNSIAYFNDSSPNIAPSLSELEEYARILAVDCSRYELKDSIFLESSGYAIANKNSAYLIIDMAKLGPDHQPGHGHADTLSFEMSLFNNRFIVNSGTSTYEDNEQRNYERGTSSHNTVVINSKNSSEIWKSFRVADRAIPSIINCITDTDYFEVIASHNGYRKIEGSPIHKRKWILTRNRLVIEDSISGRYDSAIAKFFFHPSIQITENLNFILPNGEICELKVSGGKPMLEDSNWSEGFNRLTPNKVIHINFKKNRLLTKFSWR
tara:strand:- start:507 stop:2129 length:1623 start_codon:yes stop_codon:yes gene_type:complete